MGKIYALVVKTTPLETRTKRDGSGTYPYADVTLQMYDMNGQPSTHQTYNWRSGEPNAPTPDTIRYDAVRDDAAALDAMKLQPNEIVIADIMAAPNQYGRNEITVKKVERQQPQGPQIPRP